VTWTRVYFTEVALHPDHWESRLKEINVWVTVQDNTVTALIYLDTDVLYKEM